MISKVLALSSAAGLLLLAGCGGSGTFASAPPAPTPSAPQASLSAATLAFGSVTLGQTSAAQTVTLSNPGSAALAIAGISLSDTADYALMNTCGTSLAAGASCTFSVSFKPQSAASFPATVTITDNATPATQTVALTGTGTAAAVPQAVLSPAALTFPSTSAGSTAPAQNLTLTNPGSAALTGIAIALTGANPSAFAQTGNQTGNCGTSLAAGSSCSIAVTFTPSAAAATYTAGITVTDNAGGTTGATQSATLTGSSAALTGQAQAILAPAALSFAATNVGSTAATQVVTLSNPSASPLTGIAVSIGGGAASTAFTQTNTCGATLAAGANCSITVTFAPFTNGSFAATLSVADSATNSPQTAALTGTGTAPALTLSTNTISFPTTTINTASSAYSVTLTNTGTASLTITGITLGGTNAANFTESTTCGTTLAAGASCVASVVFKPTAASAYTAALTITTSASATAQTVSITGSGTASTIVHTLYAFPEADGSVTPLYTLINNAQKTIDMTMYALQDTVFTADLVADCARGVKVRVILDQNNEKSANTSAFNSLNAQTNCSAVWADKDFQVTHQKSFILDGTQVAIMSLNLQTTYYSTTRDYALIENDAADIAAIQATFNADYAAGTTAAGVIGASDYSYVPALGDDLIWSPTTAQAAMLGIINNATSSLLVENEEMSASNIVSALSSACQRGVTVHIAMVSSSSYATNFKALEAAGCGVHVYPNTATGLYIHAKAVVADYGLSTQNVYMGSINYSNASMTENRELGLYITDAPSVQTLYATMTSDYAGGTPY